jgi:hypothetical protein
MAESDLPARRGDDLYFRFECKNSDETAFNLTGSTMTFRVYHSSMDDFVLNHADLTINAAAGTVEGWVPRATVALFPVGALASYELDREIDGKRETLVIGKVDVREGR